MNRPVPLLTDRFDQAFALASNLHRHHVRKSTSIPYTSHLMSVAALVLEDGGDEDEAIAALLHDALEDCPEEVDGDEIERGFGARVRRLVEACTDTPLDYAGGLKPPWEERKTAYVAHVAGGTVPWRVSIADKVHNARSILRDYLMIGDEVWDRFSVPEPKRRWTLEYYFSLSVAYRRAGASGFLLLELERIVARLAELTGESELRPTLLRG